VNGMKPSMNIVKRLFAVLLAVPALAFASTAELKLDPAPTDKFKDLAALQHGAKLFVNYCLNCHAASYVRYSKLKELGLSDDQVKDNLMFTADKIGELMRISLRRDDAKAWFGAAPPDLSLIARARSSEFGSGADWLYTYLRNFYRDDKRPTGWNNTVFPNVGMPHALWELQGDQVAHVEKAKDAHGGEVQHVALSLDKPGTLSPAEYDSAVGDLVAFLVYIGEPVADVRKQLGVIVLVVLSILGMLAYLLKKEYWKDVH